MIKIAEGGCSGQTEGVAIADKIPWFHQASREERWLVGVSGGADSVALLHLLVAEGFTDLVVCHLNHGLRGRASTEDAKFVKRLAGKLGVTFEMGKVDVALKMEERGESLETCARHARHDFFSESAGKHDCFRILLGHHADDQAETVLWNLLRGSNGLKGMRAKQTITTESGVALELGRPLLGLRHAELTGWLKMNRLAWREDASNAEPIAVRNRLRNEALPLLAEITSRDVVSALVRGAEDAEQITELERWALKKANVLDPQGRLHLPTLRSLPVALQRAALWEFLTCHAILSLDRSLIDRGLGLLDVKNPASINLPGGSRLRRQAGRLLIS
jgi:tRNA(Ile)-lysidine synthase